jgi:uncharacterized protein (TIGR03435 family)
VNEPMKSIRGRHGLVCTPGSAAAFGLLMALTSGTQRCVAQDPATGAVKAAAAAALPLAPPKLEFDVASVKQNQSGFPWQGGDPMVSNIPSYGPDDTYRNTGGVFSVKNYPLLNLIAFALKSTSAQGNALIASLPQWVLNESFNIEARSDNRNATKDEMRAMVRSLLEDRFHMVVRVETRQVAEYSAVLIKPGKLGPNLRQHPADEPCPLDGSNAPEPGPGREPGKGALPADEVAGGFPIVCGGFVRMQPSEPYLRREGSRDLTMAMIVSTFTSLGSLGRPVVDQTGLAGKYDWYVEFMPEYPPGVQLPPDTSGVTFLEALKGQLGIKLTPQKGPFDYILVDHIDHPTED